MLVFKLETSVSNVFTLASNLDVLFSKVEILLFKVDVVCFNPDISLSKLLVLLLTSLIAKKKKPRIKS